MGSASHQRINFRLEIERTSDGKDCVQDPACRIFRVKIDNGLMREKPSRVMDRRVKAAA
jgi:hypothetical protein